MHTTDLSHFFSVLNEKKKSFEENYKFFAPKLAPKFNIFNFVRRDENALSYIISSLLDPKGDHEQGSDFLKQFVEMLDKKLGVGTNSHLSSIGSNIENAKCETESTTSQITNNQRRIDLVVDFGHFGIGIENKPWAFDQKDQLFDYSQELRSRYLLEKSKDYLLVYLTGGNWEVSEYTISKEALTDLRVGKRFIQITYADIKDWLLECEKKCQSDRVRNFLRDFAEYCENEFGNGIIMPDENIIKDYILNNPKYISLAFQIENVLPLIKETALNLLLAQIKIKCEADSLEWIVETDKTFGAGKNKNTNIHFRKPGWSKQMISIVEVYGWSFGIRKQKMDYPYLSSTEMEKLENSFKGKMEKYKSGWHNSFLYYFDSNCRYWISDPLEISKIISGNSTLAEEIFNTIKQLETIINANNIEM